MQEQMRQTNTFVDNDCQTILRAQLQADQIIRTDRRQIIPVYIMT